MDFTTGKFYNNNMGLWDLPWKGRKNRVFGGDAPENPVFYRYSLIPGGRVNGG
jgi:hypothetical protein